MKWRLPFAVLLAVSVSWAMAKEESRPGESTAPPVQVDFNTHIRPILAKHCVACHGGVKQASGVSFIYRDKALAEGDSGTPAIVPGDVEASYMVERIADPDPDYRMPPADHGSALSEREIALVKQWIEEGAEWEEHWSFTPPRQSEPPETKKPDWPRSVVDQFVLARLEAEGLAPSPEASKSRWLRRVTFDLTGLPPLEKEHQAFLADNSPEAYDRVVDRLLASPHFGERWASVWLDLARYSDTMGYEKDPHRDMWPYRDWLIRALNDDLPYDQFLVKQLAGDLLPDATVADRIASAMHRNTQTNTEGGTDDEEFRVAAVIDRVNTTWQMFAGLTFGCTQCHSHPYDPIEHEEYYKFLAVFNSTRDCDLSEDLPRFRAPVDPSQWAQAGELDQQIAKLKVQRFEQLQTMATDDNAWSSLTIDSAESTGNTRLEIRKNAEDGESEFVSRGTPTARSVYTIRVAIPETVEQLSALRIESLPIDLEQALRTPEMGFVVTRLRTWVEAPGEKPREVFFRLTLCDEADPELNPSDSLKDNNHGWAVHPKLDRPRWAVFALEEPVPLPAGGQIKLVLKHNRTATGDIALLIQRGRLDVSDDPQWSQMLTDPEFQKLESNLAQAQAKRKSMASVSIPVSEQLDASHLRKTYVFERGNWLDKGAEVECGVPAVFPALDEDQDVDRLAVAEWFASPEHPLTARVQVNRVWEQLFGVGLVETGGDFGTSGVPPSHPKLLDDLAVRFQTEMQWSNKRLLRELVLSSVYRQQSHASPELLDKDPQNRLLARGPRERLTAEMVRDQALVLSGKFSDKMFGPSVMPPQPDGVWRSVYSGARWVTAKGADRYRRAVYTYWKRTSPYPAMVMFDVPSREVCSVQRIATNTPLQPLVTMNDPVFVECAQGFAERMQAEGGDSPQQQINWALEIASSEPARPAAVSTLVSLHDDALASFDATDEEMQSLGATAEQYARTIVASAILNLDDVITR